MKGTIRSWQKHTYPSSVMFPISHSARLLVFRGLPMLFLAGFLFGCASHTIQVPQPSRLTLTPETSMVIAVSGDSYQEVVIGLQLKKQLRKARYYRLMPDKDVEQYLHQTGQSIQDLWKDPKRAQGLNVDMVITPRIIEWKKDESASQRKVNPDTDRLGVVQYCTRISGALRTAFTLWRTSDGVTLFEDEISSSRNTRECTPGRTRVLNEPTTTAKTEERAVSRKPGASVPDPFLTGALHASWESDLFFESIVKKSVSSFIDIIDPSPYRTMFVSVSDTMDYKSSRQLVKAKQYLRKSDWAKALEILKLIKDTNPDSYATQYLIGVAQQGQRKWEPAKKSYEQALVLCEAKRDASLPAQAPDCTYIIKASRNTLTWDAVSLPGL
jgi:tetratricopeptide (TPR) repeat protein